MTDKTYYCTRCGNIIDSSTDKCTVCGKDRNAFLRSLKLPLLTLLVLTLLVGNITLIITDIAAHLECSYLNNSTERMFDKSMQILSHIDTEIFVVNISDKTIRSFDINLLPEWNPIDSENYLMDKKAIDHLGFEAKGYVYIEE